MKSFNCEMRTNFTIKESKNIKSATNRMKKGKLKRNFIYIKIFNFRLTSFNL